jgi:hypothetical protein
MADQVVPQVQPSQPQGLQLDKMQESPRVWGDTDFTEVDETDIDETKIFWMGTKASMEDTPQEKLEQRLAIQDQVRKGILDEYGLPVGFTYDELGIPKEKQDEIKAARAARQQQRVQAMTGQAPVQSNSNTPPVKKEYRNKFERKMDREKMREEMKRQEKLARANRQIQHHQAAQPHQFVK